VRSLVAALVLCGLPAQATVEPAFLKALQGAFDNSAQYAQAPDALKAKPSVDGIWLDHQFARFTVVEAPKLEGTVVYLEWRSGAAQGPISRQRIWTFRTASDGALLMDFFTFADPAPFAGKEAARGAFLGLEPSQLKGYGPSCTARFTRTRKGRIVQWEGRVDPTTCNIVAGSGRSMTIDARIRVRSDGEVQYQEAGQLSDGRFAFRVPPERSYIFRRTR
jgi:hypothetical protein